MTIHVPPMRPEPPRDGFGRYLIPDPLTGVRRAWTRSTTLAHSVSDTYNLTQWKRRKVAEGLAKRPELLVHVASVAAELEAAGDDWRAAREPKKALDAWCDEAARAAGAETGSSLGTALHSLTEWSDAGRIDEVEVPDILIDDLRAYIRVMDLARIERPVEWIERRVVNVGLDTAGTLDRIVRLPDGRVVIADLKTQKTVDFGWLEIAIQLATYAYADFMVNEETGALEPMPAVDKAAGLVIHLPVGSAKPRLYEIDLEAGIEAAELCLNVRAFRAQSKRLGRPYVERVPASGDQIMSLIRGAMHSRALEALWRDASARGEWTEQHTAAAAAKRTELRDAA